MRYKCIKSYFIEDVEIMHPGDFVVINNDNLFNISNGVDYKIIGNDKNLKSCLEVITDEISTISTPYKAVTDLDRFRNITKEMTDTFVKKNQDYGNSFEQSLNEEGIAASRIRMGDKWNRFKQLSKGNKALVNNESLRDTLLDIANYAIMTMMWLDKNQQNGNV